MSGRRRTLPRTNGVVQKGSLVSVGDDSLYLVKIWSSYMWRRLYVIDGRDAQVAVFGMISV
jgi:hypothetical protein